MCDASFSVLLLPPPPRSPRNFSVTSVGSKGQLHTAFKQGKSKQLL